MAGLKAGLEARLKAGSKAGLQTRVFPDLQTGTAASTSHAATTRQEAQRLAAVLKQSFQLVLTVENEASRDGGPGKGSAFFNRFRITYGPFGWKTAKCRCHPDEPLALSR